VYLAGPISGLSYGEATDWRELVKKELAAYGIVGLSPMRGKEYLQGERAIADSYKEHIMSTDRAIGTRDAYDVRRSDAVLFNFLGAETLSGGSFIEVGMAHAWRKLIVVVMEESKGDLRNVHDHGMLRDYAHWVVPDLEAAVYVLRAVLGT
jgi:nucleoside 2-deoxyribosyltransferase